MSRFNDVIDLIKEIEGTDADGFPAVVTTERFNIFANRKGVRSSEFYQASQEGYALEVMFIIRSVDYESEESLRYKAKEYTIIRTYDKGEFIELVCTSQKRR
ncbi:phage head closure protein [Sporosarcina sp. ANT_H38]|uniref:phage head closure protein n=1 Tax=Sporosarcina sp. ANT_H38 TaxID=2597358 RepID=UPI00165DF322|nr:phage head closure protein [Sporosarcina sp. ANT_H38]